MSGHDSKRHFEAWANAEGYDTAHTCDTERNRWIFLNPMTADLWKSWQAASAALVGWLGGVQQPQAQPVNDELLETLARVMPVFEASTRDLGFTATKAGEFSSDMQILRTAIAKAKDVRAGLAAAQQQEPRVDFLHRALLTKLEELQKRAEERRQKYRLWQGPCEGLTDAEARTAWLTAMGFDDGTQPVNEHDLRYLTRVIEQALAAKWGITLSGNGGRN